MTKNDDRKTYVNRIRELEDEVRALVSLLRLERENGHRFLTAVLDAFPGEVRAVSVSRPRLEDVFIQRTGHRFWTEATDGSAKEKAPGKEGGHD